MIYRSISKFFVKYYELCKKKSVSWEYIFFPLLHINSRLSTHGGLCIDNMTAFSHEDNIEVSNFSQNIYSDNIKFVLAFN